MPRVKRFQNLVTRGHFTLPIAIFISAICWIVLSVVLPQIEVQKSSYPLWNAFNSFGIPLWGNKLLSFALYSVIGYFLIELNNSLGIIRMRASVQTAIYFLLISVCPSIHMLYAGDLASAAYLIALYFLFKSYQQMRSSGYLFHAFVFIGAGSLLLPQLTLFAPIFWIGAYNFRSLHLRSFFASLIGWSLPYFLLFGYAFYTEQVELFYHPFRELATFNPIRFDIQSWEPAIIGYMFVLFIASSVHCFIAGYEDKIRTRSYLHFLIFINFCIFIYIGLQPSLGIHLLSLLFIGVSILAGHLFVLTSSRTSNIFFIFSLIGLLALFGFNIWKLL